MLAILVIALVAALLTVFSSSIALARYRRTVAKLMSSHVDDSDLPTASGTPSETTLTSTQQAINSNLTAPPVQTEQDNSSLYRQTITEPRLHAGKYAIAGALFALLMGLSSYYAFSQSYINYLQAAAHPLQLLFMFWTFAWPIVLTINTVAGNKHWRKWLVLAGYFLFLFILAGMLALTSTETAFQVGNTSLPAWSGDTPIRLLGRWCLFNLTPTLLLLAFRRRHVRAVAPLVLSFMTVTSIGVLGIIVTAFIYLDASAAAVGKVSEWFGTGVTAAWIGYFVLLFILASVLFGVFGWWLVNWIRQGYLRKTISDQSLELDALWLVFAAFYAMILAFAGPGWALSAPLSFIVYKITVNAGNRWLMKKNQPQSPALLVLRVFSLGKRSEFLFDLISRHWRYIGDVRLIAGVDLALATVTPQQFLSFVSGKISQLFIRNKITMDQSLAGLDTHQDADGRYRVNDFFCHANTWQPVLSKLVNNTDIVLMDLRSFAANNAGCIYEIRECLNNVPLQRLIFIIDATTDREFLNIILDETCSELRPDSPNLGIRTAAVQPIMLKSSGHREILGLLRELCKTAAVEAMPRLD